MRIERALHAIEMICTHARRISVLVISIFIAVIKMRVAVSVMALTHTLKNHLFAVERMLTDDSRHLTELACSYG
jgi:hypothetical protein